MTIRKPVRLNHPDDLPNVYQGRLRIIGTLGESVKKYRALHAATGLTSLSSGTNNVTPNKQPLLMTNDENKAAYMNNNFGKIKDIETKAQNDLQPVYTNISNNPDTAWVEVEDTDTGDQFYMAWSSSGSVWSFTQSINPVSFENKKIRASQGDTDTKYEALVQFGTYSQSGSVAGIHSYNIGLGTMAVESVIAMMLAKTISGFVSDGLGFLVSAFAERLGAAAAEVGLEVAFVVPEFVIGAVAACLCFAIVFVGLAYLWNWINRQYTIRVQIFNWDTNNDWQVPSQALSNAINPGKDNQTTEMGIKLDKMVDAGAIVYPPGFQGVKTLDNVVYYCLIIYENDHTFAQGCSFAVQMQCNGSTTNGSTYAFQCPRWSDNGHYMVGQVIDANSFLETARSNWTSNMSLNVTTANNIPVNSTMDALSGADNQLYNINIHINKSS
ncbi:hypothetical protein CYY_002369 [Polysphondylium violaceum]|uniref:Uncharacterized protein n=1 Tax=Polysphondylium violaceum TaxID=133409 RepID=A0A8J4PY59_9MYCE|nr:hypothetical protein CYY_002369 [Polysphondylium violaceum]